MISECREQQLTEAEALQHIFGAEKVAVAGLDLDSGLASALLQVVVTLSVNAGVCHDNTKQAELHLQYDLPVDYPESSPPRATISGPDLPRHALDRLQEAACCAIEETFTGSECLFDVTTHVQEFAASVLENLPELQQQNCARSERVFEEEPCHSTLFRIDHMNDRQGYCSLLQKWAEQLSLRGNLLLGTSGPRPSNIALLLSGGASGVNSFVKRLRTEYVDVNSRGQKCKERKSDVLCSFVLSAEINIVPSFDIKTYSTTQELHSELQTLGVLEQWMTYVK